MSVKKINNRQVVSRGAVNRASQRSFREENGRLGNRSQTIVPGKDFTKNYSITLKDIDTTILSHIKEVMKPTVREANEVLKVPVMWANEERWKMVRKNGVLRDKNGSIILPLIIIRRTDTSFNEAMPLSFDHDVEGKYIQVTRNQKWSKDNRYDRFTVQNGMDPIAENIVTGVPDFVDVTYDFILWTNYIEQMNGLVELFIEQENKYWGDTTDYKFLCNFDTITDASEMDVGGERMIRSNFSVMARAYLLPEYINSVVTNKVSTTKKQNTISRITFGFEGDATDQQVGKK